MVLVEAVICLAIAPSGLELIHVRDALCPKRFAGQALRTIPIL